MLSPPCFDFTETISRLVFPRPVHEPNKHETTLVHAVALARFEVVDGMHAVELLGREYRVLEHSVKLWCAGLGFCHRALGGVEEDEPGVEAVGGEPVGGGDAGGLEMRGAEGERDLLAEMRVRQLLSHDHRAGRDEDAFGGLAADADEV